MRFLIMRVFLARASLKRLFSARILKNLFSGATSARYNNARCV
jgi:hypothetical protein